MLGLGLKLKDGSLEYHLGEGEWTTGNITFKISNVQGAYRFEISNKGFPGTAGLPNANWTPEPLLFQEIYIAHPSTHYLRFAGPMRSVKWENTNTPTWTVVTASDRKQASFYIPGSDQFHCIEGGTSIFWEAFQLGVDTNHQLYPSDIQSTGKVKSFLGIIDGFESTQYPLVKKQRKLWSVSDMSQGAHIQDLGWYMANYNYKFGGNHDLGGFYNLLSIYVEEHSNYRYMPELYCLERYFKDGDVAAFELAVEFMKRKYMLGFFKTDKIPAIHRYGNGSEQSTYRIGDYSAGYGPEKTWHAGLCAVALLTQDPDLLALRQKLEQNLLAQPVALVWDGAWGERKFGWYLYNLRAHYEMFGNEACSVKAKQMIDHVFIKVGARTWFQNDGNMPLGHDPAKAWMAGKAIAGLLKWHDKGHMTPHMDRLKNIIHWYLNHGIVSDLDPRVIYEVSQGYPNSATFPTTANANGLNTAELLWGLLEAIPHYPTEQRFKDVAKKQANLVLKHLGVNMLDPIPTDCTSIAPGPYGTAAIKIWLGMILPARDKYLQLLESL